MGHLGALLKLPNTLDRRLGSGLLGSVIDGKGRLGIDSIVDLLLSIGCSEGHAGIRRLHLFPMLCLFCDTLYRLGNLDGLLMVP